MNSNVNLINGADGSWNYMALTHHLPTNYAKLVMATPIISNLSEDSPCWPHTQEGIYSVKSGYRLAMEDRTQNYPSTQGEIVYLEDHARGYSY